jgi:hypothetical protein
MYYYKLYHVMHNFPRIRWKNEKTKPSIVEVVNVHTSK